MGYVDGSYTVVLSVLYLILCVWGGAGGAITTRLFCSNLTTVCLWAENQMPIRFPPGSKIQAPWGVISWTVVIR